MNYQLLTVLTYIAMTLSHWIADFIFQNDEEAIGKSTNFKLLIRHTSKYTLISAFLWWLLIPSQFQFPNITTHIEGHINIIYFMLITFTCHTITDFFTSKWTSKLWKENKRHLFFVVVGFDQLLHFTQLFLTYYFLIT